MDTQPHTRTEMTTVAVRPRSLVVLAGLPGAGKSRLLERLDTCGLPAVVLDSDQMRAWLRTVLPAGIAYRYYRPLVHLTHRLRVLWYAATAPGLLVVHEPSTRPTTRALLVAIGALTRRPPHYLWLDATAAQALDGQIARGRMIRGHSFERHARRAEELRERFAEGRRPRGWHELTILSREGTEAGLRLCVTRR